MTQPNQLRDMSCTHAPNHGMLETLLERTMDMVTDILDG